VTSAPHARPAAPALVLVTDSARLRGRDLAEVVSEAVAGGVNVVQLREKTLPQDDLVRLGERVGAAIAGRALLFINSDVAAAVSIGADGVHLPEDAPLDSARESVDHGLLVSRAVHSIDAAVSGEREGADLILLGTVFETASKPGALTIGIEGVQKVCERVSIPVIGIGGITTVNAADVIRAGAAGVAVIGAVFDAPDPRAAAAALRAAISAPARA
jgi:thiamine-phosphate pyrophosphorylase